MVEVFFRDFPKSIKHSYSNWGCKGLSLVLIPIVIVSLVVLNGTKNAMEQEPVPSALVTENPG
jgi:hypothetical protein